MTKHDMSEWDISSSRKLPSNFSNSVITIAHWGTCCWTCCWRCRIHSLYSTFQSENANRKTEIPYACGSARQLPQYLSLLSMERGLADSLDNEEIIALFNSKPRRLRLILSFYADVPTKNATYQIVLPIIYLYWFKGKFRARVGVDG